MKKVLAAFIGMVMLLLIPIHATAHPGSTDGSGGHYDRSTGEYHYHHGYSAHDHYDMNGDGIDDCPYNFADKTDTSNRGSYSSEDNDSDTNYSRSPIQPTVKKETEATDNKEIVTTKEKKKMPAWGFGVIGILTCICIVQFLINRVNSSEIDSHLNSIRSLTEEKKKFETDVHRLEEENEKILQSEAAHKRIADESKKRANGLVAIREEEIKSLRREIEQLQNEISEIYKKYPYEKTKIHTTNIPDPIEIPDDVYFVRGKVPVKGKVDDYSPFGDFTVFISKKGKKFHLDEFCGSSISLNAAHVYDVLDKYSSCDKCALFSPYRRGKTPDWYRKIKQLEESLK